ncbi:pyridoxamine 5'-phosphate oxidase [Thermosporothrix hazakensis]|jgi:hypothetical protein|uniref:Pyridoxamine 5'-phosphate oxidase n=2 Tax=Thermosporothrix TaxID=768650 RepID=A0A326U9B7_THEHA|nr:pyridoxamine 5'-phosphate oxidase family protein [Thermosporothrix hazakensis]PZW23439.1 pyridoxamine 5'-phosphate oxidase [Thermosporothrix hazakensis]BBH89785.1 hypothetical protein KTC_45360 [Thermosporothrix sp. COM3]GCE47974.1 hypothetical protein KTH_28430 [Thermosporothrix hazakensis]
MHVSKGQMEARARWGTQDSGADFDRKKTPYLSDEARAFISRQSFCVVSGPGMQWEPRSMIIAGNRGFILTPDAHTCVLKIPFMHERYRSAHLLYGILHQLLAGQPVKLSYCFVQHATRERLCVQGEAEVMLGEESDSFWLLLHVTQAFFHCSRYVRSSVAGLTASAEISTGEAALAEAVKRAGDTYLSPLVRAYLAQRHICFLCSVDEQRQYALNHRGGSKGFLVTLPPNQASPRGTILLPDYRGNGAFEAIGNILETGKAALLVPDYVSQMAVCIVGQAQVFDRADVPPDRLHHFPAAERIVALTVTDVEIQKELRFNQDRKKQHLVFTSANTNTTAPSYFVSSHTYDS